MPPHGKVGAGWAGVKYAFRKTCVVRGQFLKMYQQVAEREHKEQLLPVTLRDDIKKIASKFSLKLVKGGR